MLEAQRREVAVFGDQQRGAQVWERESFGRGWTKVELCEDGSLESEWR